MTPSPSTIGAYLFRQWCDNYDTELKEWYADAMDTIYETWKEVQGVGSSQGAAQEVFF